MSWKNGGLVRDRQDENVKVEAIELFFDLIYVFSVTQLSHYLLDHLTLEGAAQSLVMWFAVWLGWQHNTWITNWFDPEKMQIRLMLFAVMLVGLVMAVSIPSAFESSGFLFALSYVLIQLGRSTFILISLGNHHRLTKNYRRITIWMVISALFWIGGAFQDNSIRLAMWGIAAACDYCAPMIGFRVPWLGRSHSENWDIDGAHMAERCQLFVIVALGESILTTGATMSSHAEWTVQSLAAFAVSFVGSLALWWIYFDTGSKDGSKVIAHAKNPGLVGAEFNYIHVTLVAGIIVSAVANELVIAHPAHAVTVADAAVVIGGPAIYLGANALYKKVVYGEIPKSHLLAVAALVVLIPLSYVTSLLTMEIVATTILIALALWDGCNRHWPLIELP